MPGSPPRWRTGSSCPCAGSSAAESSATRRSPCTGHGAHGRSRRRVELRHRRDAATAGDQRGRELVGRRAERRHDANAGDGNRFLHAARTLPSRTCSGQARCPCCAALVALAFTPAPSRCARTRSVRRHLRAQPRHRSLSEDADRAVHRNDDDVACLRSRWSRTGQLAVVRPSTDRAALRASPSRTSSSSTARR